MNELSLRACVQFELLLEMTVSKLTCTTTKKMGVVSPQKWVWQCNLSLPQYLILANSLLLSFLSLSDNGGAD